jgi:hypothetical protein
MSAAIPKKPTVSYRQTDKLSKAQRHSLIPRSARRRSSHVCFCEIQRLYAGMREV